MHRRWFLRRSQRDRIISSGPAPLHTSPQVSPCQSLAITYKAHPASMAVTRFPPTIAALERSRLHDTLPASRVFTCRRARGDSVASAATVSAHVVRGLISPTVATAFVSSPTSGTDAPIPLRWTTETNVVDTGLRVVCFNVANTSTPRVDRPEWPRVTSVGLRAARIAVGLLARRPDSTMNGRSSRALVRSCRIMARDARLRDRGATSSDAGVAATACRAAWDSAGPARRARRRNAVLRERAVSG